MKLCNELGKYYSIDKIKYWGVFVWNLKEEDDLYNGGCNLFDIYPYEIFYFENHTIKHDALPIVKKIQEKLIEMDKL